MEKEKYYVYIYLDPRKIGVFKYNEYEFEYEPIYVGKGCRNRINHHLATVKIKKSLFYNKLNKIIESGYEPIRFKLIDCLNEEESLVFEKLLISLIGRIDIETGSLCNMTEGGEKGFKRTIESRKKLSDSKIGDKNPMYGKTTTQKQKDSVKYAHKNKLIKLTIDGRNKIIESAKKRLGTKNLIVRCDIQTYMLVSPLGEKFEVLGVKKLQEFCKNNKLQYHVIKNNIDIMLTEEHIIGKKINAKNTIGWKIEKI